MALIDISKDELLDLLKAEGLDAAEDLAVAGTKAAFNIIRMVVPKVSAGLGVIIAPLCDMVEPKVLSILDKIDGEDDPNY